MWAVFYANGMVLTHEDKEPQYLPKTGVVAIAHQTPNGKRVQRGKDYYWLTDDPDYTWYGGDSYGLWERLTQSGSHVVLFGRSIPDADFAEIVGQAVRYEFD